MLVTDIKETQPAITANKRAILYARVSSDDTKKDGRNLQGQLEMGREYAISKGYSVVAELAEDDRGASGADIDLPQLNRIREMTQNGEFDVLIVREIDRLSRNLAKQLIIEEELKRAGVSIEYVLAGYENTAEGRLSKHVRAVIAEYEREKIKERTLRGRDNKIKSGGVIVGSRPQYGYRLVVLDGQHMLEPDEVEASIVKLIFEWYALEGQTLGQIAKRLTEMGVITPGASRKGGRKRKRQPHEWIRSTIGRMLRCRTYIGEWYTNKTKLLDNGKRTKQTREHHKMVSVPSIIDHSLWDKVQDRIEYNKINAGRNKKNEYLLTGHIRCAACGFRLSGKSARGKTYYYCPASLKGQRAHKCEMRTYFRVDVVDSAVWGWIKSIVSDPDRLEAKLLDYQAKQDLLNRPLYDRLEAVNGLIGENERKLNKTISDLRLLDGSKRAMALLQEEVTHIETMLDQLEAEKEKLDKQLNAESFTQADILEIKEFASIITQNMDLMDADFAERRWFVERLQIEIYAKGNRQRRAGLIQCILGDGVLIASHTTCSVHDTVNLEQRGLPMVFVASSEFEDAAEAQASALGFDAARVFVPHPIQDRTDDEVRELARNAIEDILQAICQ